MEDDDVCKRVLIDRATEFAQNINTYRRNGFDSPIFDLLDISIRPGIWDLYANDSE